MKKKSKTEKVRTNVTLNPVIFQMVKDNNLNLSSFVENKLVEYFLQLKQLGSIYCIASNAQPYTPETHRQQTQPTKKHGVKTTDLYGETSLWGFEPQYPAPKAGRISRLPHRPITQKGIAHLL